MVGARRNCVRRISLLDARPLGRRDGGIRRLPLKHPEQIEAVIEEMREALADSEDALERGDSKQGLVTDSTLMAIGVKLTWEMSCRASAPLAPEACQRQRHHLSSRRHWRCRVAIQSTQGSGEAPDLQCDLIQ